MCAVSATARALDDNPHSDERAGVTVDIGGIAIRLRSGDADFRSLIEQRYSSFVNPAAPPAYTFDIDLRSPSHVSDSDAIAFTRGSTWIVQRGDFQAEWDIRSRHGVVRQSANPYSLDTVLRITHSLALAAEGGFLLHAASAVRNGRAFVLAGISGAGKTTMSRLAPPDATVLTDEISYLRRDEDGYRAYGTPFAGELARIGANVSAPIDTVFLLEKGQDNRIEAVSEIAAARALLRHLLFFANDGELVTKIFDSVLDFVRRVHVVKLVFTPDARAWELIR